MLFPIGTNIPTGDNGVISTGPEQDTARTMYNAELSKITANPGAYDPNERASFFGSVFGNSISPQEYLGALESIYGAGSGWATPNQEGTSIPTTPTGGTGGTGATTKFDYNGMMYDSANVDSMNQFKSVRQNELNSANSQIDTQASRDYQTGLQTYGDQANQFNQNLDKYNKGTDEYSKQLSDLYEGFGQGNVARQNYFTRLAPDTYQSGQGSSADYANTKYQQGYGETNTARNEYGANLNQGLERLGQNWNNFNTDQANSIASQKSANNRLFNDASVGTFGNKANYNGFSPVADVKSSQVDLSKYTPFTNFQGLQSSAGANMFKKFQPTQNQDPLAQTLGYQLPTKAKDPLNSYLYNS